ncbi:hypothetical protein V8F33_008117 [Rhypophila sp. PSN 637]
MAKHCGVRPDIRPWTNPTKFWPHGDTSEPEDLFDLEPIISHMKRAHQLLDDILSGNLGQGLVPAVVLEDISLAQTLVSHEHKVVIDIKFIHMCVWLIQCQALIRVQPGISSLINALRVTRSATQDHKRSRASAVVKLYFIGFKAAGLSGPESSRETFLPVKHSRSCGRPRALSQRHGSTNFIQTWTGLRNDARQYIQGLLPRPLVAVAAGLAVLARLAVFVQMSRNSLYRVLSLLHLPVSKRIVNGLGYEIIPFACQGGTTCVAHCSPEPVTVLTDSSKILAGDLEDGRRGGSLLSASPPRHGGGFPRISTLRLTKKYLVDSERRLGTAAVNMPFVTNFV